MIEWYFLSSTRKAYFIKSERSASNKRVLYLDRMKWAKLCKSRRAAALLRDFGVHLAMIEVFNELPLREQISWLGENLIPRTGFPAWSGRKMRCFEGDEAQPITRKWLDIFKELENVPYIQVNEFDLEHGNQPEFKWVGSSSKNPPAVYFSM
jgi:hypothetical protein